MFGEVIVDPDEVGAVIVGCGGGANQGFRTPGRSGRFVALLEVEAEVPEFEIRSPNRKPARGGEIVFDGMDGGVYRRGVTTLVTPDAMKVAPL